MSKRRSRIVVVALALVGAVGCGGTDYESLHRGECLPSTAQVVGEREPAPPTVDCSEPHRYQVYGVTQLDGPRTYPGEDVVDPHRRLPHVAFQGLHGGASGRGRTHIDVSVPADQAEARVAAVLAAGGRLADASNAPLWWTVASPENHGVDIAAWPDLEDGDG